MATDSTRVAGKDDGRTVQAWGEEFMRAGAVFMRSTHILSYSSMPGPALGLGEIEFPANLAGATKNR